LYGEIRFVSSPRAQNSSICHFDVTSRTSLIWKSIKLMEINFLSCIELVLKS
jgi:hypothetical protein